MTLRLTAGGCVRNVGAMYGRVGSLLTVTALLAATSCSGTGPTPAAHLTVTDLGVVIAHGHSRDGCDRDGARDVTATKIGATTYLYYDGATGHGWTSCLATSTDGQHFKLHGTRLPLGARGRADHGAATSPWIVQDPSGGWSAFYMGTRHLIRDVPAFPYTTMYATSPSPAGPWTKHYDVTPFQPTAGSWDADTASPGPVIRWQGRWLQFFSGARAVDTRGNVDRTLGLATADTLRGPWTVQPAPLLPVTSQVENASLYYQRTDATWWLFTNHVWTGNPLTAHSDAIYAYWSTDPTRWNRAHRAVVIDAGTDSWSHAVIGMPAVVPDGARLLVYYDGLRGDRIAHLSRDVAVVAVALPLRRG